MSKTVDEVIEDILQHAEYDPVARREYYLRNRKLKGRKTVNEDEVPSRSPTGGRLVNFDGANGGRATYTDGSTFDGNGWNSDSKASGKTPSTQQRVATVRNSIDALKISGAAIQNPKYKRRFDLRVRLLERRLALFEKRSKARDARTAS